MIWVIALLSREIFDTQFEKAALSKPPWLTGGTKISQQTWTNHHWLSRLVSLRLAFAAFAGAWLNVTPSTPLGLQSPPTHN